MTDRIALLRIHQRNIDRYQSLLTTKLSEIERRFLERRVSEERFAIAMLEFMSPAAHQKSMHLPVTLEKSLRDSA
jgi:hypothetical protein